MGRRSTADQTPASNTGLTAKGWDPTLVGDLLTLAITLPLLVTTSARPRADYLSFLARGGQPGPDTVGAALAAVTTAIWLVYLAIALLRRDAAPVQARRRFVRPGLLAAMTVSLLVLPTVSDVGARMAFELAPDAPVAARVHDGGVLQTEAAANALVEGRNPYAVDYQTTAMARSHHSRPELWRAMGYEQNPAFEFYPYPPLTFLSALHGADQRLLHLLALLGLGAIAWALPRHDAARAPTAAAWVLGVDHIAAFVEGTNDILCVVAVAATVLALRRGHPRTAAMLLAVACGFKQLAWLWVPIYVAQRWGVHRRATADAKATLMALLTELWPAAAVIVASFVPFALWAPDRFAHGLWWGQGALYPVRATGLGVSGVWIATGVVTAPRDPTPSAWLYAAVVLPVMVAACIDVARRPAMWRSLAHFALVAAAFAFVSRHFAVNHLWVIVAAAVGAAVMRLEGNDGP